MANWFRPKRYVPINPTTIRCDKKYCTVTSISLRVCKAISINKAQGASIEAGKPFESVIIFLPEKGERINPGSELVEFPRVTDISALAICNTKNDITLERLKKIGTGSCYIKRKQFDKLLKKKDDLSRRINKDNITKLHIVKKMKNKHFGWMQLSTAMVFEQC